MIEEFSASDLLNLLSSAIISSDSQLLSIQSRVLSAQITSPELNGDLSSSVQRNVLVESLWKSGVSLYWSLDQVSVLSSDQLERLKVVRGESAQHSASQSDSVNGQSAVCAVEVLSHWRGGNLGLVSEVVSLSSGEHSVVVLVGAGSSGSASGVGLGDLRKKSLGNSVVVSSGVRVTELV